MAIQTILWTDVVKTTWLTKINANFVDLENRKVNNTGAETIGGVKTFTNWLIANTAINIAAAWSQQLIVNWTWTANTIIRIQDDWTETWIVWSLNWTSNLLLRWIWDVIIWANASSDGSTWIRVLSSGNVWIGTTSPWVKLEVAYGWIINNSAIFWANSTDLNTVIKWWNYNFNAPTNRPSWATNWGYLEVIQHYNWSDVPNWQHVLQRWTDLTTSTSKMWQRVRVASIWGSWVSII